MKAESPSKKAPVVVAALPLAYREGADEYDGIMRYLYEKNVAWDLRVVRHSFSTELFRDFIPAEELSGVIMGLDYRPGIVNYCPYAPVEALDFMEKRGIPVVTLDFPPDIAESRKHGRLSFLEIDSEAIGREAAHYFAKAGEYASYGFVGAFEDKNWSRNRGAFFAKELRLLGRRNVRIFHGGDLAGWLGALLKPAAVFASNDWCADRVLKTCAQAGLRVPEDLSVLGVDDDPIFCMHATPTLSSLHPDFEAEGHAAAEMMAEFLAGRTPPRTLRVTGETTVVVRMSTAPCSPAGQLVRKADGIIAKRACKGLNADMLADALGISRRLLDLRYRQINGVSVRTAIENSRLERVRELLSKTRYSHTMIARSCGYSAATYLEHVFAKRFGLSMSEFRQGGGGGTIKKKEMSGGVQNG